ncbi:MAG: class I SAM-dependent methyltransferase [Chloroflexota bacterium]
MTNVFTTRFSHKAEIYARYRWRYAPEAIQRLFDVLPPKGVVADIGAGTGILTRPLLTNAACVYAVEPNAAMRSVAEYLHGARQNFRGVAGTAEATTLPEASVDLIAVAQALHWCDPAPTVREFRRILKPGGWLALLWNNSRHTELGQALQTLHQARYGWDTDASSYPRCEPYAFYFGHERYAEYCFPVATRQTWEEFFGCLCSDSHAPLPDHPAFADFEAAAQAIYNHFRVGDTIPAHYQTELVLGQLDVTKTS